MDRLQKKMPSKKSKSQGENSKPFPLIYKKHVHHTLFKDANMYKWPDCGLGGGGHINQNECQCVLIGSSIRVEGGGESFQTRVLAERGDSILCT